LKIKDLRDVGKSLKIKHLLKFFAVFQSTAKPTYQARRPAHPLARFLQARPSFFQYIFLSLQNCKTKNKKLIKSLVFKGLEALQFSLQWLCSGFAVLCNFAKNIR
jgi:hypothetical protein